MGGLVSGAALAGVGESNPSYGNTGLRKSGNQEFHMGGSAAGSSVDTEGIPIKSISTV